MSQDQHIMLDLETMSTQNNAAILTAGAVLFDPRGEDSEDSFRATPDRLFMGKASIESNEQADRHISASTVKRWLQQSKDAQSALFNGDITNLKNMCFRLRRFMQDAEIKPTRVWAKSPDFDCTILGNAFQAVGEVWPFKFWETRCVRTITELAYPEGEQPKIGAGVAHNALDDAIRQALMVQHCHHVLTT